MADSNSKDDSKEDQDANTSAAAVEEPVMTDKGSVDCKEQNMGIPVDNICYEKLQTKSYLLHQEPIDCFKQCLSGKYTHPVNMGIPGFPFLHDFKDPVVTIGTQYANG